MDTLGSQDYDLSVLLCPPTFPQETLEKLSQPQNKTVIVICHWKGYSMIRNACGQQPCLFTISILLTLFILLLL